MFTVTTAAANPTYQWRKDGVELVNDALFTGVQTNTLTIANVGAAQLGQYDVVITDGCSIASDSATLSFSTACSSQQSRLYVDASVSSGICGSDWGDAYASIQTALDRASTNGFIEEIWVARGTYATTIPFELINGVALVGGFAGNETHPDQRYIAGNETKLDGTMTSVHVVKCESGTPILDGFTITGGNAAGTSNDAVGGGMFVNQASPSVRNCRFTNNYATSGGGAIRAGTTGTPMELINCMFQNNTTQTTQPGAAIRMIGGRVLIDGCTFTGGIASAGGAIWQQGGQLAVANSVFFGNEVHGSGGGSAIASRGSLDIVNCTLAANLTQGSGRGALSALSGSSVQVFNTIIWENNNSFSEMDQIREQGGFVEVYDSVISGLSSFSGNNNTDNDPGFANPPVDFRLTEFSAALDSGDNARLALTGPFSGIVLAYDRDQAARILNGTVDRGAYEYAPQLLFDGDRDGDIDMVDARAFEACMQGPTGGIGADCTAFDGDADGHITLADFAGFQMAFTGSD
jgi:predicted outer membrane repeat protein